MVHNTVRLDGLIDPELPMQTDVTLYQGLQGPCARRELAELLEVLLDLQARYCPGPLPQALAAALRGALPALQVGYGGTLSAGDRALLRALLLADRRLRDAGGPDGPPGGGAFGAQERSLAGGAGAAPEDEGDPSAADVAARFRGPLARAG